MAFSLSIVIGGGNLFYYFLDILKIVFVISTSMALVYFAIADKEDYENWDQQSYRKKAINEKLLLALLEGIFFHHFGNSTLRYCLSIWPSFCMRKSIFTRTFR